MTRKRVFSLLLIAGIVGSIWYLESHKNRPSSNSNISRESEIPIEVAIQHTAEAIASSLPPTPTSSVVLPTSSPTTTVPVASHPTSSAKQPPRTPHLPDRIAAKTGKYERVKEISSPDYFINVPETFTLAQLVGKKVILVDFWTYSCINCQRMTPYLNAWYEKYKDQGLEIVGIHTPEFEFEKKYENVLADVKEEKIKYPVVMDNDYSTWTAYKNRFWPHRYLIDIDGFIAFDQIGEGAYDEMEREIQKKLNERALALGINQNIAGGIVKPDAGPDVLPSTPVSIETYFGAKRNRVGLGNAVPNTVGDQTLTLPAVISTGSKIYLDGSWRFEHEYAHNLSAGAKIIYKYQGKNVYFVANATSSLPITILRDGKSLTAETAGADVTVAGGESRATIQENRMYRLIKDTTSGLHVLEIIMETPGLHAFTFTFG